MSAELRGTWTPAFDGAVHHLAASLADRRLGDGAQLCVFHKGEPVIDIAVGTDGLGRPLQRSHLFAVYCTTKPLVALAVATLIDAGRVTLATTLGEVLGAALTPRLRDITMGHVLSHTAGLHQLPSVQASLMGPRRRHETALRTGPPPRWQPGEEAGYSEYRSWHLLGEVLEAVTGTPAAVYVRQEVIERLGLTDQVLLGMTAEEFRRCLPRLGVNVHLRGGRRKPLMLERTESVCTQRNLGLGGRANARGLATFYARLEAIWHGDARGPVGTEVLRVLTQPLRPPMFDHWLNRVCTFGGGFMVGLKEHFFGWRCSPESFGHSGYAGMSAAWADPSHNLAVAFIYNGYIDAETSTRFRRETLSAAVYESLLGLSRRGLGAEPNEPYLAER